MECGIYLVFIDQPVEIQLLGECNFSCTFEISIDLNVSKKKSRGT